MQSEPFDLRSRARYIGSLVKGEQLCDFYEIVIDGHIQYIYIPVGSEQKANED